MVIGMYSVHKVNPYDIVGLYRVEQILHRCGENMAIKHGLQHWNNSHFKNAVVMALCIMKNKVYLVYNNDHNAIATFQIRKGGTELHFQKLATDPVFSGKGVGSFCLEYIERVALAEGCDKVCLEVYDKSKHAIGFYINRGYWVCGSVNTLKYTELKMEKYIGVSI